tara:strand:+ start:120 stop:2051 length:1932 start_codon:yes stop_codon:yes gene_type:complete
MRQKLNSFLLISFLLSIALSIEIISTNDLHGNIAPQKAWFMNPNFPPDIVGGAGLKYYVEESRKISDEEILIFDAGNFFQGHPYGMSNGGMNIIDWMNDVGYTALVPGVDDFVLGAKNLNKLANEANFPFLMSNIICDDCPLKSKNIKQYLIKNIDGLKIGVIGIVNTSIPDLTSSINILGIEFENSIFSIEKWVEFLKNQDVDSIIILTSSGVPYDREDKYKSLNDDIDNNLINPYESNFDALGIARFSEGIDIIISGGVSKGYNSPWYDPYTHTYVFQNFGNGTGFGHFKMIFDYQNKIFKGYKAMVDNKISQTLLKDDFDFDVKDYEKIELNNSNALKNLYSPYDENSIEKNMLSVTNQKQVYFDSWKIPKIGSKKSLEVMTWNCEFFPAAGDSTIRAMSEAIYDMDVDIIAFQEIKKAAWFEKLMLTLPEYEYVISQNSSFFDQAYIFKKDIAQFLRIREPFSDNDYNFAGRPPLRLDLMLEFDGTKIPLSLINIHMKCCDSGLNRRKKASQMLYDYINDEIEVTGFLNFIVLGDWNDDLKDDPNEHCFGPFLKDKKYHFLTDKIDDNLSFASYPKEPYVSFLDHIMTTNQFISADEDDIIIETVLIENYIGGFDIYEKLMSDHRPVMFSIPFNKLIYN